MKVESEIYDLIEGDFVVKALFKFSHENFICFVMEYMYGGDFSEILNENSVFDQETARFYVAELVLAIENLHKVFF